MTTEYLTFPNTHRGVRRLIVLFALVIFVAGCGGENFPAGTGRVTTVIDGDTIRVRLGTKTETVRLIGVNTPETVAPNKPVECFGPEASARTKELLGDDTVVRLERDATTRDRFGRLLAYVYRVSDDLFINLSLIAEGYGKAMPFDDTPMFHVQFADAELVARNAGLGLWGACPQ
jgi:micrococcal nuclease